ncbi:CHAD domain-containing protein [Pseudorhodoferax sp.]|uniref:CYTH and CHAD domain-containing protein n=1 Tax=Pseudorhodoferax sp. TaxID=1993553 RepID=UPI0039E5CA90
MEIEFKFQIPAERLAGVAQALQAGDTRRQRLQARYFDTADGALAAQGAVLRLRKEGRHWVQTAKALGEGPVHRLEHNVALGAATPAIVQPELHAGTPAGDRLRQALAGRSGALLEVYGTDIRRTTRVVAHGASRIELALDEGHVTAPPARRAAVCELELELLEGEVADLAALAGQWAREHGLWFSTVSKAERGLRLARDLATGPAVKARPPDPGGGMPGGAALQQAVLRACLAQILPNASEVAAGSDEAEHIHQLRVGLRRLRTALRELAPLGPHLPAHWQAPLREAFAALGARRDRQLLQAVVVPQLRAAGGPALALEGDDLAPAAGPVVRGEALQAVLVKAIGAAAGPAGAGMAPQAVRRHLKRRLDRLHAGLLHEGRHFDALPPERQHALRKRLKRLRYLAEFAGPVFGAGGAERFARLLAPAQDALGACLDEQVALAACRTLAARVPEAWFAVGWLQARQTQLARAGRKALRALGGAPRFWKKKG